MEMKGFLVVSDEIGISFTVMNMVDAELQVYFCRRCCDSWVMTKFISPHIVVQAKYSLKISEYNKEAIEMLEGYEDQIAWKMIEHDSICR
jgi:hypothetical protein